MSVIRELIWRSSGLSLVDTKISRTVIFDGKVFKLLMGISSNMFNGDKFNPTNSSSKPVALNKRLKDTKHIAISKYQISEKKIKIFFWNFIFLFMCYYQYLISDKRLSIHPIDQFPQTPSTHCGDEHKRSKYPRKMTQGKANQLHPNSPFYKAMAMASLLNQCAKKNGGGI